MTLVRPPLASEREGAHTNQFGQHDDALWEDCGPCSLIMAILAAHPELRAKMDPDLHVEAEKLRHAAGYAPTGGTAVFQFAAAIHTLYGVSFEHFLHSVPDSYLQAYLVPGKSGAVTGNPGNFPAGHRLRRWLPGFSGGHVWFVSNEGNGVIWLMDPLGPKDGTYAGEAITMAEVLIFFSGTASLAISSTATTSVVTEAPVKSFPVPKAPAAVYVASGKRIYLTSDLASTPGNFLDVSPGRAMPYLGVPFPGVAMVERTDEAGAHTGMSYFIKQADITAPIAVPVPVPGATPAQVNAAVAAAVTVAVAPLNAKLAQIKALI